jgi:hypothetical protein
MCENAADQLVRPLIAVVLDCPRSVDIAGIEIATKLSAILAGRYSMGQQNQGDRDNQPGGSSPAT